MKLFRLYYRYTINIITKSNWKDLPNLIYSNKLISNDLTLDTSLIYLLFRMYRIKKISFGSLNGRAYDWKS